jgi:hypothetical protein
VYGIVYIVLFAAASLILLILYDKRNSIINFFKQKRTEKVKVKPSVVKQPVDVTKKHDSDKDIKQDNISYGSFKMQEDEEETLQEKDEWSEADTIFTPLTREDEDQDDFDIEQMLREIELEQREEASKRYESDSLDPQDLPDFDNMSMAELNRILEDDMTTTSSFGLPLSDKDNLSGEVLGEYVKNLPHAVKILIATDIFKRKF